VTAEPARDPDCRGLVHKIAARQRWYVFMLLVSHVFLLRWQTGRILPFKWATGPSDVFLSLSLKTAQEFRLPDIFLRPAYVCSAHSSV
jgi:hypothetical protein